MDCNMPEMSGYEATAAIRSQEGSGPHTPIIAMTAGARLEDRARCLAEGMDGYLAKPISKDSLLALVARFVKKGRAALEPFARILLVEDNPVNQQVGLAMLEALGYQVDVVANGSAAVEAAILTSYHAILMDCHIPILDGYDATREIRRLQGAETHTPIIAVTASAMESDHQGCLDAGMDDYLAKPLTLKTLAATLARWAPGGTIPAALEDLDDEDAQPAVDPQIVDRLVQLGMVAGDGLLEKLTALFVTEAHARVAELRGGVTDGDVKALWRAAHALSGSSATLGATGLARLCSTLASDCAVGELNGIEAQLDTIDDELARVLTALGSNPTA
jgi:CheY-like chemotaxis protein/HPt (histidine-containing phosphotransfer) domain-containing protein